MSITLDAKIFVAGHRGLVGSALVRRLRLEGYDNLVTSPRRELDLLNQAAVDSFFAQQNIDVVLLAAARVGGILANSQFQADFLYENLMIAANVIRAAANTKVKKLVFLGSSCIYPKLATQPIDETSLLTGSLEPTNEGYAIAKIAGLKLCELYRRQYDKDFVSVMPTNLYGPGDNFDPDNSHVIPGLMRRFHEAHLNHREKVSVWGSGSPKREFLYVDDLASAVLMVMNRYSDAETINIGTGEDITICELASLMKKTIGYQGEIEFDSSKPDGTPRKVLNVTKIKALGWTPQVRLEKGLRETYQAFQDH
jgi:GDP-L-fucose synthase